MDDGQDFTSQPNLEVVEEQMYSMNFIADAEINTENEMSYEEWLAAQGLVGLKASWVEENVQRNMAVSVQK